MEEIWKPIEGYEEYYDVSNLGNVRSKERIIAGHQSGNRVYPGKILKPSDSRQGYHSVVLSK